MRSSILTMAIVKLLIRTYLRSVTTYAINTMTSNCHPESSGGLATIRKEYCTIKVLMKFLIFTIETSIL